MLNSLLDSEVRELISDVQRIDLRLDRAESFRCYLDLQWSKMNVQGLGFDWRNASVKLKTEIDRIRNVNSR